jgi:hypothetical protein
MKKRQTLIWVLIFIQMPRKQCHLKAGNEYITEIIHPINMSVPAPVIAE